MKKAIDLNAFGNICIFASALIIVTGFVALYLLGGLALGIDFKSGISIQVQFTDSPSIQEIRETLSDEGALHIQRITNASDRYIIKSDLGEDNNEEALNTLQGRLVDRFGEENIEILEVSFSGPRYSRSIARQSIVLTLSALLLILLYIWFRFRLRYSISAIAALVHDVLMIIVFIGVTRIEFSVTTIAAVLTTIGYSLNDTVVIFDRIRENHNTRTRNIGFAEIVNKSISQSLSRTIITSLTTLLAVLAIFIFSSGLVKDFALCMIFGVVVGTYSSIFIASPVLVFWSRKSSLSDGGFGKRKGARAIEDDTEKTDRKERETKGVATQQNRSQPTITVNTMRIKQEVLAMRKRKQKKGKKKK